MTTFQGLIAILLLPVAGLVDVGRYQSAGLNASVVGRAVVLHYSLSEEDQAPLEQLARGCTSGEVQFAAELRKIRLFWPDLSFATTVVRNRFTCDSTTHHRVLSRIIAGASIEILDGADESSVVPFLANIGQGVIFDAGHFSSLSSQYLVRVTPRVIAPDGEYQLRSRSAPIMLQHR